MYRAHAACEQHAPLRAGWKVCPDNPPPENVPLQVEYTYRGAVTRGVWMMADGVWHWAMSEGGNPVSRGFMKDISAIRWREWD